MASKRELEAEVTELRAVFEEIFDRITEVLGLEDTETSDREEE